MHYHVWSSMSEDEIAGWDIAHVNLEAAFGLPGAGEFDLVPPRRQVDDWAAIVEHYTKRIYYHRSRHKELTDAQFRIMSMITVLQRDLGVTYNLAFSEGEADLSDSQNLFLHGILQGHGGTCVTMPVLYIAIGRRLGYPLKLVKAKEHYFCRWDDGQERFNIEATSRGFNSRPDEFYLKWPKPLKEQELRQGIYLRNLSPKEELAAFISERAVCFMDNLQMAEAVIACHYACEIAPHNPQYRILHGITTLLYKAIEKVPQPIGLDADALERAMPTPQQEWERLFYPAALCNFKRIVSNRTSPIQAA